MSIPKKSPKTGKTAIKKAAPVKKTAGTKGSRTIKSTDKATASSRSTKTAKTAQKNTAKKAVAAKRVTTSTKKTSPSKVAVARKAPVKKSAQTKNISLAKKIPVIGKMPVQQKAVARKASKPKPVINKLDSETVVPNVVEPDQDIAINEENQPLFTSEWIGISAMKAVKCPECEAQPGILCISSETGKRFWESHPARMVAYTKEMLASKSISKGTQYGYGK